MHTALSGDKHSDAPSLLSQAVFHASPGLEGYLKLLLVTFPVATTSDSSGRQEGEDSQLEQRHQDVVSQSSSWLQRGTANPSAGLLTAFVKTEGGPYLQRAVPRLAISVVYAQASKASPMLES